VTRVLYEPAVSGDQERNIMAVRRADECKICTNYDRRLMGRFLLPQGA
jgi:hypothetical protein